MADFSETLPLKRDRKARYTHIIRPNHRGAIPAARVYVDTEALTEQQGSLRQRQTLWFGWACFERVEHRRGQEYVSSHWLRFETAEAFFTELQCFTHEKTTTYVYAHNLQYDAALLSLASMAESHGWQVSEYVPANHLLWLTLRRDGRGICFIDTLNYFQTSLAKLGESIGEYKTHLETQPATVEQWSDYCKQDVQVLVAAMHAYFQLIHDQDLGAYRKTAASQAYGAWRHRFMHSQVLVIADERLEALERSAYHGGRSEVFYDLPLCSPVIGLDVNSMFPWVMHDGLFPARKLAKGHRLTVAQLKQRIETQGLVAEVTLQTDVPCYPFATSGRVLYPTGQFTTTLSTPEIAYALEHGHILSVGQWAAYELAPLFHDYVETLYQLRLEYKRTGNDAFAYLCKLLLNSLYGKFGQRGYQWTRCEAFQPDDVLDWLGADTVDGPVLRHKQRFGEVWHQLVQNEAFESFPAIAAHITAGARMALWGLIERAGQANVYYVDTDSLYVSPDGYRALESLVHPTELGKLKVESVNEYAHFMAPKDYALPSGIKLKGVRRNAWQVRENAYLQPQFESYDQALGRGVDGEILVTLITKTLHRVNLQSKGEGVGWRSPLEVHV